MNHTEMSSTGTKKCNGRTKPHVNAASRSSCITVFFSFFSHSLFKWHGALASSLSSFSFSFSTSTVYSIDPMAGARQTLPTLVFGGESKDERSRDQNNNKTWREASKAREYYLYPSKYVGILLRSTQSVCSISCSTKTFLLLLAKTIQKRGTVKTAIKIKGEN